MNPDEKTSRIDRILQTGILDNAFTAGQAALYRGKAPLYVATFGTAAAGETGQDTLFDIASLTKLFATFACLRLVDRGILHLDDSLGDLCDVHKSYAAADLAELLTHEAGFPPWLPLFESVRLEDQGTQAARAQILSSARRAAPAGPPGTACLYSDIGYLVLLQILENTTSCPISQLIEEEVCRPLGLVRTRFLPLSSKNDKPKDIAPTEDCPRRGKRLIGEVHDDNAWAMGGEAAHAGLFSTAREIAALGAAWLRAIKSGEVLSKETARTAVTRRPLGRGLGWDFKTPPHSSAGARFGETSFGHLGFTGCSLWVDPSRELSAALLTNRVYFGRENEKLKYIRPQFHDAAAALADNRVISSD